MNKASDVSTWFGIFAKGGVPRDVQEKLNTAVREVMNGPRMQEYLKSRGASYSPMNVAEFDAFFDKEVDRWAEVVRKADVKGGK